MIGCLVIAFALCQTGYYQPAPAYYAPPSQVVYAPAPQPVYYGQPAYPTYPVYGYGAPVALNVRVGGWGGGGHWHR